MLTAAQLKAIGNFDPDTIAALAESLGFVEDVSAAGTINLKNYHSRLAISGSMAFTLPDGTVKGQRKKVSCESAASTPVGTLTVTTPDATVGYACPSTFVFDTAGQSVEFMWTGSAWRVVAVKRAGTLTVVVGTDVLTGKRLSLLYALSVTGTVNSTGTKALPNGSCVGDRAIIGCSTAASTPVGSIDATVNLASGAAGSGGTGGLGKIGNFGATTSNVVLEWTGTAWQVIASIGSIVAS